MSVSSEKLYEPVDDQEVLEETEAEEQTTSKRTGGKLVGKTKPSEAEPGTIRGDYCIHTERNIIHASDSDESAAREIALWFKDEEIFDWKDCEDGWY